MPGLPRPSALYSLVAILSWPVVRLVFRLRARGLENVPAEGGLVLAANHWSNVDPWPLGLPLFPRRFLRFMAKAELFWFPLGHVITAGGAFPVRRGDVDRRPVRDTDRAEPGDSLGSGDPCGHQRDAGLERDPGST